MSQTEVDESTIPRIAVSIDEVDSWVVSVPVVAIQEVHGSWFVYLYVTWVTLLLSTCKFVMTQGTFVYLQKYTVSHKK